MTRTIYDKGKGAREVSAQARARDHQLDIPGSLLRTSPPDLPEVAELTAVRHYTSLSQKNYAIDTRFYPLGSCTMKYNPRAAHKVAFDPGFLGRHPLAPDECDQGFLQVRMELEAHLKRLTGMAAVSLTPMAGAQGEFAGLSIMRAYLLSQGESERDEILVPEAAHGTNPASAVMCGFKVREIPLAKSGDIDEQALRAALSERTAGLMLTNPSTCGLFEQRIVEIAHAVHESGGLLYYDGANLNAIVGRVRPADMGFDVIHMNLHKTFATPHGGGGPGAGPIGVVERLKAFLPMPYARYRDDGTIELEGRFEQTTNAHPSSIGRLSAFGGNAGVLIRALAYIRLLGGEGLRRVSDHAVLASAYIAKRLSDAGFELAWPDRRATHEFVISLKKENKDFGVTALDFSKRLLDYGFHPPTNYFPLLVPECFLIEPTETESLEELDAFVDAMIAIREEAAKDPSILTNAPHTTPVSRLDEVKAVKSLDLGVHLSPMRSS